ncbi:protein kinase domain-containing protein [Actinokineospora sp.]|uniref:protein kinase domain-containing protein n=1 Tax=Actinokineospora sp. TaxID=1872133 RepID=UPI004037F424
MHPTIPGLTLGRPLGQGGFGTVFLARQVNLERDVAVKVDNRVLAGERDRVRFLREARAAARLSGHPNVVNVYDAGVTADGRPFIVMELCTGGSLADELARDGALPVERVIEIGGQLADALAHVCSSADSRTLGTRRWPYASSGRRSASRPRSQGRQP